MKLGHFNHERLIIIAIWIGLIGTLSTLGWELPVKSVINPTCNKSLQWEELDDSCKLDIYKNGEVPEKTKLFGDLIFSALRGSSYSDPRTKNSGGHPSLDIVSVAGTPVYSIYEGVVIHASLKKGYGKSITLKHTTQDGTILYSSYSHLSDIFVKEGDIVPEGEHIGDVGRTGFTIGKYGNHLDFQITTADSPSHPYGYYDCEKSYYDAVEEGACKDKLKKYTIDPIIFFLKYGDYDLSALAGGIAGKDEHSSADKEMIDDAETTQEDLTSVSDNNISTLLLAIVNNRKALNDSVFGLLNNEYDQFNKTNTINQKLAGEVKVENSLPEDQNILPYTIKWTIPTITSGDNIGKITPIYFTVTDKFGAPFTGIMEEKISIEYNKSHLKIAPGRFAHVMNGSKNLFITPLKNVNTTITIKYGETILGTEILFYSNS